MRLLKKSFQNPLNEEKAFTLIEVMLVMAIIGILAATALANFNHLSIKAYDATALVDTRNLADSIVNAALHEEDVDFSEIGPSGEVGIKDRTGNPRAPIFYLSPGVSARITQVLGPGVEVPYEVQAEIYHTKGTSAGTISGKKEFTCIVDEVAGVASLP